MTRSCERCGAAHIGTMLYHGLDYRVCRRCANVLRAKLRDLIIANNRENDRLIRERDSLEIVAACAADDDADGLAWDDAGALTRGWAF